MHYLHYLTFALLLALFNGCRDDSQLVKANQAVLAEKARLTDRLVGSDASKHREIDAEIGSLEAQIGLLRADILGLTELFLTQKIGLDGAILEINKLIFLINSIDTHDDEVEELYMLIDALKSLVSEAEFITVCPNLEADKKYKEALIYLDGRYLAYYKNNRLTVLDDGTYRTTDGRDVIFRISGPDLICL